MVDLSYARSLLASLNTPEIEQAFRDVLSSSNDQNKEETSRLLSILAIAQLNSLTVLNNEIREKIIKWVNKNWDLKSTKLAINAIDICRYLSLNEFNETLENILQMDIDPEIKSRAEWNLKLFKIRDGENNVNYYKKLLVEKISDNNLKEVLKLPDGLPTKLILDYLDKILDYAESKERNLSADQVDEVLSDLLNKLWPSRIVNEQLEVRLNRWLKR